MKRFKNILVGVDFSEADRLVAENLAAPSERALEQALWLAEINDARVTFLYALDVCPQAQHLLAQPASEHSVVDDAVEALGRLVRDAEKRGVAASFKVALGHSWNELIIQVLDQDFDLLVVGSRRHSPAARFLLGSTGMKLLRKCPCPVWITKPQAHQPVNSILVAHDLSPVGTLALELGASLSQLQQSALHVLHAIGHGPSSSPGATVDKPVDTCDLEAHAVSEISKELKAFQLDTTPHIEIVRTDPAESILEYIAIHHIELLVMGTVARSGITGVITGNTAERMLERIPCSVLAVKPSDFVSPVKSSC